MGEILRRAYALLVGQKYSHSIQYVLPFRYYCSLSPDTPGVRTVHRTARPTCPECAKGIARERQMKEHARKRRDRHKAA